MFKIGDVVRVRRDLKASEEYGENNLLFEPRMIKYKRKLVKIKEIYDKDKKWYKIEEDDGHWIWAEEMFMVPRGIKKQKETLKDGDIVKVLIEPYKDKRAFYRKGYLEFFEYMGGHDGSGNGLKGYCWYLDKNDYEKVELEKVRVYNLSNKVADIEKVCKDNEIMPLFNGCYKSWLNDYDTIQKKLDEDNICELVYRIIQENDNILILRKDEEYFMTLESNTKEPEPENNVGITKDLISAIDSLKEKIEERSPFQEAMTQAIIEKGKELATEDLKKELKQELNDFIEKTYGVLPKKMIIEREETKRDVSGLFHKDFEKICKIVDSNVPLMLVGGAGAGKNHTLEQVAEALGLTFYTTNAVNQDYKLTGFIDANGKYHETEFYKAFTNGGMFFLDEIDASCPEALIILNGAIANKYFDFPVGRVQAHKDFRVVCAGNTYGTGADMVYVGRNVLDGATLDRFVVLNFDYDEDVEKALAYDKDLFTFIRDLRKAVNDSGLRYIVSMRALINSTKLLEIGIDKETILKTTIIKNMQVDDINTIVKKIKHNNDWLNSLKRMSDIDD